MVRRWEARRAAWGRSRVGKRRTISVILAVVNIPEPFRAKRPIKS